jgi:hypothetical protein
VGDRLGLGKRPILWCYRPVAWPAWNHEQRRVARFWSADGGLDDRAIDALRERRPDRVAIVEPTPQDLASQLTTELEVSRRHLRTTLDRYWDREWRRAHRVPEDHLWRAASAVADMTEALG